MAAVLLLTAHVRGGAPPALNECINTYSFKDWIPMA